MGDLKGSGMMGGRRLPLGLDRDDPVKVEEGGGMHTELGYRLDLLPPRAVIRVGEILRMGVNKGYARDNWRELSKDTHVNHALGHIMGWMMGDISSDHLAQAACRLLFAMEAMNEEDKP